MDQVVADYITANTPISPAIQGSHRLHHQRCDRLPGGDTVSRKTLSQGAREQAMASCA